MNMDGKICQKLCACCASTEIKFFINSTQFHTLCYNCAQRLQTKNIVCIHCETQIHLESLVEIPPPRKCDICGISPAKKCEDKKHAFCVDCRKNFIQCPLCYCGTCLNKSYTINSCRIHSQCQSCLHKYKDWCRNCYCHICQKHISEARFPQCRHPVCSTCYRDGVCLLCDKKCTYCPKKVEIGIPICKKHPYCKDCNTNLIEILRECPECKYQTNRYKCFGCQLPRANTKSNCNTLNHNFCEDCIKIGKQCDCKPCFSCEKILECSINDYCKHISCKDCKGFGSCKKCKDMCVYCSECNQKRAFNDKFFQCNKHNACDICLGFKKECQKCLKKCEKCEIKGMHAKLSCGHVICEKCLRYTNNNCVICLKCYECKTAIKRANNENKSLCDECFVNLKKNKECALCENLIAENYFKCKHNYCKKCMSEIKECQICKICKGCKKKIGIHLNKSKHWVCDSCYQNQKCCDLCMETKRCDICFKISKNPSKYDCGRHKGCKKCKKYKVCKCINICINCCEYDLGDFMNCSHFLCKKCKESDLDCAAKGKCTMCLERCFSCRSSSNLNPKSCLEKKHILCKICNPHAIDQQCLICTNELKFGECQECKKKNYISQFRCLKHLACLSCLYQTKFECEKCLKTCKECNCSSYVMENGSCGHDLCKGCQQKHLRNCEFYKKILCEICQESLIEISFDCLHQICRGCSSGVNYCIKCYSQCDACGDLKKIEHQCEHKLCGECFSKYNKCGVCSQIDECKCDGCKHFVFNLLTSECGHKFCENCIKSKTFNDECQISICHYCDKCSISCEKNLDCKKNICSVRCKKYKDLESCPKCSQLNKSLCLSCNHNEYGFNFDCNHFVCIFCDTLKCPLKCLHCDKCELSLNHCKHLCVKCLDQYEKCYVCLGYIICENKKHIKQINSICEQCKCLHCGEIRKELNQNNICDFCVTKQKQCKYCFEIYYIDDIQNENALSYDICNKCLNSICLKCNGIFHYLLDLESKICNDCFGKEKCYECHRLFDVSKIILQDNKCIDCSEFIKCKDCGRDEKKKLFLSFSKSIIEKGKCLECLGMQQCQKCLNYFNNDDMTSNNLCIGCGGLGRCLKCQNLENIILLREIKQCANCAGFKLCSECKRLKDPLVLDEFCKCYDCLGFKQCLFCRAYKPHTSIHEDGVCEGCPKIKCNSCSYIYDRSLPNGIEICPQCKLIECPECHRFLDKAQINYNDNCCIDCPSLKSCGNCESKITRIVYETYYGYCANFCNSHCYSCITNKAEVLMKCNHLECKECNIPNNDYCSKCLRKFRCHIHETIQHTDESNKYYIYMDCCKEYFCKNCKAKYDGSNFRHRSNCKVD